MLVFVCSCNALTDKEVIAACRDNARSPAAVYRCLGCRPRCGTCLKTIQKLFADVQREHLAPSEIAERLFADPVAGSAEAEIGCSERCADCPNAVLMSEAETPALAEIDADR